MWLGFLGPLSVWHDGVELPIGAAKQRAVLAALALRAGHVVSLGKLCRILWDEAPPAKAGVTTRNYVRRLRQNLGPAVGGRIVTRDPGYLLSAGSGEVDVLDFGRLCETGGAAARAGDLRQAADLLSAALALWRGAPFADVPSQVLHREQVPQLEQMRLQAVERQISARLGLGLHADLIPQLEGLVARHPLREMFHAQLMLALYRCGNQGEALAAYQRARQVLLEELGVEPGPDLREVHQRILASDPALIITAARRPAGEPPDRHGQAEVAGEHATAIRDAVVPRQLPNVAPQFVGRGAELRTLSRLLHDRQPAGGSARIAAICGTAGVGKTALAVHWAHQVAGEFPDGQLYVNLRGFDPSGNPARPAEVIRGFLDAFAVRPDRIPASLEAQAGLYRSMVSNRRLLILLDNASDAGHVRPLLPGAHGCLVVVTSRSQLTGLVATEGAMPLPLDVLSGREARELLARRLGPQRLADEARAAGELIELCARLPLALSIVAARAATRPAFPLATLVAELRSHGSPLDALDCGEAHSSVRAMFSWSFERLSDPAARLFRLLGLHPGPDISVPAAASLAGILRDQAGFALAELAEAHMLVEHVPGRFAFHDLLRSYAAEQAGSADGDGERRTAIRRMLDHYLHTGHAAALLLYPTRDAIALPALESGTAPEELASHEQSLRWFEAEHRVLLAVITQAAGAGLDAYVWWLAWVSADFFDRGGYWHDWSVTQRAALAAARRLGDRQHQAWAHRSLGRSCVQLGAYQEAHAHLSHALGLWRELSDRTGQARTHLDLAWACERQGRHDEAVHHDEDALALFRAAGQRPGQADALNAIGWDHFQLGDYQQALIFCRRALDLYSELGHSHGEAAAWDSLGCTHHRLGDHGNAAQCLKRSLDLCRRLGDRYHQAQVLIHLGDTHAAGDPGAARDAWLEALGILNELQHPDAELAQDKLNGLRAATLAEGGNGLG